MTAVALQVTPAEIRLTMAGNKDIEPEAVSYLQSIWEKLQAISKLQFDRTRAECDLTTTTSPTTTTPSPPKIPNPRHYEKIKGDSLLELLEHLSSVYNLIKSVPSAQTKKEQRAREMKTGLVVPEIRKLLKGAMRCTTKLLSIEGQATLGRLGAVISVTRL